MPITAESFVGTVLQRRETWPVFMRNRMHCPGCAMARFMTVAEAATSYRLDPNDLVDELRNALGAPCR